MQPLRKLFALLLSLSILSTSYGQLCNEANPSKHRVQYKTEYKNTWVTEYQYIRSCKGRSCSYTLKPVRVLKKVAVKVPVPKCDNPTCGCTNCSGATCKCGEAKKTKAVVIWPSRNVIWPSCKNGKCLPPRSK